MLVREAPELFETEQDLAKRLVKLAVAIRDWERLLLAIDLLIGQQGQFVAWWDETVHRKGGERWLDVPVRGHQRLSSSDAETRTGIKKQQVSRWRQWLDPEQPEQAAAYRQRLRDKAFEEAGILPRGGHRTMGTGDNEWFTPPAFIAAARDVLETIDLDPATHAKAQKRIKATHFYTRAEDGLRHEWAGRVWLNPPYGRVEVGLFVDKLLHHCERREIEAAILLTHNYTDTRWFHAAAAACKAICFTRGRIEFEDKAGETCKPAQGQAFFYFGAEGGRFLDRFREIGFVVSAAHG